MHDLTRERIAAASPPPPRPVVGLVGLTFPDEAHLRAEMLVFLHGHPPGQGLWLFTYGALMGKPETASADMATGGRVAGYARSFCLYDVRERGTFEAPGLTLGLEPAWAASGGPGCSGALMHLPGPDPRERLWPAWKQEMGAGFYVPVWVDATLEPSGAPVRALTFVVNRDSRLYAGRLPVGAVAERVAGARGEGGTAADYLLDVTEALERHGLRDPGLDMVTAEAGRRLSGHGVPRPGSDATASATSLASRPRVRVGPPT